MTLNDILHALDQLKADELTQVQKHLDHLQIQSSAGIPQETPADTIAALRQAFAAMREGLDEDDLQGLVDAMHTQS